MRRVKSVALLYYHLLTGISPCDMDGHPSFSQLGLYLPGDRKNPETGIAYQTLGQFEKGEAFPRRCEDRARTKQKPKGMTGEPLPSL